MTKPLIVRLAAADISLGFWLKNQILYLKNYYNIICVSSPGPYLKNLKNLDVEVYEDIDIFRKINFLADIKALIKLYKFIKTTSPSIVHTFSPKGNLLGVIAAFFAKTPIRIISVGGHYYESKKGIQKRILMFFEGMTYYFSTIILVNSYHLKLEIETNFKIYSKKVHILDPGSTNGIDTNHFKPKIPLRKNKIDLKRKYFNNDDIIITYIGRINKDKGIITIIQAMDYIDNKNVKLLIIGPYEDNSNFTSFFKKKIRNKEKIIYLGMQTDIKSYLSISSIYVHPSYREGLSNSLMEACSMELPCVVSSIPGNKELIAHNKNGLIAELGNPISFANEIKKIINDPILSKKIGSNARKNIVEKYDQKIVWKNLRLFYEKLLR